MTKAQLEARIDELELELAAARRENATLKVRAEVSQGHLLTVIEDRTLESQRLHAGTCGFDGLYCPRFDRKDGTSDPVKCPVP